MPKDRQHQVSTFRLSEIQHEYGPQVHILNEPYALTMLAQLGHPSTVQPYVCDLVQGLYEELLGRVFNECFPKVLIKSPTRMGVTHSEGVYEGIALDQKCPVVTVNLARAGSLPSQTCYMRLNRLMNPQIIRQDHFYINRRVNEKGQVIGVDFSGSKIGGSVEDHVVLLPDPMGATGSSMAHVINYYKEQVQGTPKKFVAMHLIITPEYIQKMREECPDVEIFGFRLDRGLSHQDVLDSMPGSYPDEEKGLNDHQYIVPGAGGLGEVLNNSYV